MKRYYYYTTHLKSVSKHLQQVLSDAFVDYSIIKNGNAETFEILASNQQAHIINGYLRNYFTTKNINNK